MLLQAFQTGHSRVPAGPFWLGVFVLWVAVLIWSSREHSKGKIEKALKRARQDLVDADYTWRDDSAYLLARAEETLARIVKKHPGHAQALHLLGATLTRQAMKAEVAAADLLFQSAETRYAQALAIDPTVPSLFVDRAGGLIRRSFLHSGESGVPYLAHAIALCEQRIHERPLDPQGHSTLGYALCAHASRMSNGHVQPVYQRAEGSFEVALKLRPDDTIRIALAFAWLRHARTLEPQDQEPLRSKVAEICGSVLERIPSHPRALLCRAYALFDLAKRGCSEATARLIAATSRQFDAAAESGRDVRELLEGRGVLLWAQALCCEGAESTRLLREAQERFVESESRMPRICTYNLACIHAQLGELEECRRWLEASLEPGVWVSREQMANERELQSVRECDWFRALLLK